MYLPLVKRVMEQSQQSGFGLKTVSFAYVGHAIFLCGQIVGLLHVEWYGSSRNRCCRESSACCTKICCPAPIVDIPSWMIADYYRYRSENYARRLVYLCLNLGGLA